LASNVLSGPAFPPSWLQPGTFPNLQYLTLAENAGLSGTLPSNLSWPTIKLL
jgi:hypothetical protein